MPPAGEGDETRRLSIGAESRIIDVTTSSSRTASPMSEPQKSEPQPPEPFSPEPVTLEPGRDEAGLGEPLPLPPAELVAPQETAEVDEAAPLDEAESTGASESTDGVEPSGAVEAPAESPSVEAPSPERAPAGTPSAGRQATTVLVRNAIPAGSGPAPVDAGVVYVASRRTERLVMALSTVLGTLGLLLAVAAAGLDQVRYNLPAPCAAYQTNHHGAVAFGCTAGAKQVAVLLPVIGIPVLVLIGLIAVWVPGWRPRMRFGLLGALFALIVACAVAVALAYTALPKQ